MLTVIGATGEKKLDLTLCIEPRQTDGCIGLRRSGMTTSSMSLEAERSAPTLRLARGDEYDHKFPRVALQT